MEELGDHLKKKKKKAWALRFSICYEAIVCDNS